MTIPSGRDAHDVAFEALLPLAQPTADALREVDDIVADERKAMDPLREGFTPMLKAGVIGLGRFGYAVRAVGKRWLDVPGLASASTPEQEANNVFLWLLGGSHVLRIKRDPVDGVAEGTQRLFAQLPAAGRPSTVFLTWDIDVDARVTRPRFACLEEPRWTISLSSLLAHAAPRPVSLPAASRGPGVQSKKRREQQQFDDGR